jgi:orotate phosphoribosyltransferase-like protein
MRAILNAPVPRMFANGLGVHATATDVSLVFLDNDSPVGIVTVGYPLAKTMISELSKVIHLYETKTGETVKELKELVALLGKQP